MALEIISTSIDDVKIIRPKVHIDERGFFMESWNKKEFFESIGDVDFVQDNFSLSKKGVIRGLHFQLPPYAQSKLVRCVYGSVFDVAVDIRQSSPTFKKWFGIELSSENKYQMWIPEGFAHGFIALSDYAALSYKTTKYWNKSCEASIRWNDPSIGIEWPVVDNIVLSSKDRCAPYIGQAQLFD